MSRGSIKMAKNLNQVLYIHATADRLNFQLQAQDHRPNPSDNEWCLILGVGSRPEEEIRSHPNMGSHQLGPRFHEWTTISHSGLAHGAYGVYLRRGYRSKWQRKSLIGRTVLTTTIREVLRCGLWSIFWSISFPNPRVAEWYKLYKIQTPAIQVRRFRGNEPADIT
jgi:hypothetical protein